MKLIKYIVRASAMCALLFAAGTVSAQKVQLKVMVWNVLSFEETDFVIDEYVKIFAAQNADIICLNEFESGTSRQGREKIAELASRLNMFPYYIMSYPKDVGYYGNGILSKYPIVTTGSMLISYKHYLGEGNYQFNNNALTPEWGADQRSVGYADVLVPTSDSDGQIVRVVCTHLDHQINSTGKRKQAQEVSDFVGLANPVYPMILMGDLNAGSAEVPAINDVGDLVHSAFVDFIYTYPKGKWTKVSSQTVNGGSLSDHSPIVGTVTLN